MSDDKTLITSLLTGSRSIYCYCETCKQVIQQPTYNPYNFCPYCGRRIVEGKK